MDTKALLNDQMQVRRDKLAALREQGIDPFGHRYRVTHTSQQIKDKFEILESQQVTIAGRIMSIRGHGKVAFMELADRDGSIQIYVKRDDLETEVFSLLKKLDIGDILGVSGSVFRTQRGEITVHVNKWEILSKSLLPLPEKYHGLKDTELRYRQRYVDLIVNPDVRNVFVKRSLIIRAIRCWLDERGYLEVETPTLHTLAGGASARPFITHHNALGIEMYLRIALELYLKRLIVGGLDRVYEIGRVFRNEGIDLRHNPEFTLLELYEAFSDYEGMMELAENMIADVAQDVLGTTKITYQGHEMELAPPWNRITMVDAVKQYTGIDYHAYSSAEDMLAAVRNLGLEPDCAITKGALLNFLFEEKVEKQLVQPTFICDYPLEISPLAKKMENPEFTYRFEGFVNGSELCNAFSELNDPDDQRERFEAQMALRAAGDEEAQPYDEDYICAMEHGLPPTGGIGFGIDRLVMLLTDSVSVRDVILFPTMKPLDTQKDSVKADEKPNEPVQEAAPVVEETIDFSKVEIEPLFQDMVDFDTFSKSDFRAVKVKECEAVKKSKKLLKFVLDDGTGTDRVILSGIHMYYEPEELVSKTLLAITNLPPRPMMGIDSCGMLISAIHSEEGEERLHLIMLNPHIPAGAKIY